MKNFLITIALVPVFFTSCGQSGQKKFTDQFMIDSCRFTSSGRNTYFILEPGYQLVLEGKVYGKTIRLIITVLDETKKIGNIETRVIEEREFENGEVIEISRNYFALCQTTGSIFYFGEEVDIL